MRLSFFDLRRLVAGDRYLAPTTFYVGLVGIAAAAVTALNGSVMTAGALALVSGALTWVSGGWQSLRGGHRRADRTLFHDWSKRAEAPFVSLFGFRRTLADRVGRLPVPPEQARDHEQLVRALNSVFSHPPPSDASTVERIRSAQQFRVTLQEARDRAAAWPASPERRRYTEAVKAALASDRAAFLEACAQADKATSELLRVLREETAASSARGRDVVKRVDAVHSYRDAYRAVATAIASDDLDASVQAAQILDHRARDLNALLNP